ncbi:hypothetical protein GCM10023258_39420 [Terrabacter aeriphilus]|uniref:Uncharacterized protein n=1 Tax=Terrabacter aeriphilus TaxID=515662 RepID=A0ABP9JP62_9MICO
MRGAHPVGFVAHELDVDHAGQPIGAGAAATTEIRPGRPAYVLGRAPTSLGSHEGVCRHGVGRQPADVDLHPPRRQAEVLRALDRAVARKGREQSGSPCPHVPGAASWIA